MEAESGLVHSVVGTAANESDISQTHAPLHGEDTNVFGDTCLPGGGGAKRTENRGTPSAL